MSENMSSNLGKKAEQSILFLHKKILPQKNNPISCIVYDPHQNVLRIYLNNYKQAEIS